VSSSRPPRLSDDFARARRSGRAWGELVRAVPASIAWRARCFAPRGNRKERSMKTLGLIGTAVIGGLLAACSAETSVGTATVTAASNVPSDMAIDKITTERCNRELSCDNIGPDRYWDTM